MKENIPPIGISETTPFREVRRLPEIIDAPYPRIAIGDIFDVASQFDDSLTNADVQSFQNRMFALQKKYAPPDSTFFAISSKNLVGPLEDLSLKESQRKDKKVAVVHLDRYISPDQNEPPFYRLNVSRGQNDTLVSRPGHNVPPEQQLIDLRNGLISSDTEEIIIIDDVIAYATTLIPLIENIRKELPEINIRVAVAIASSGGEWRGIEKIKEQTGIDVETLTTVKVSPKNEYSTGMSAPTSRDMTIFGGSLDSNDGKIKSFPHLFPFNIPKTSFMNIDQRYDCSLELLDLNIDLVTFLENRIGSSLTIQDLIDKGFGIPSIKIDAIKAKIPDPSEETLVLDYLNIIKKAAIENFDIFEVAARKTNDVERFKDKKGEIAEIYKQAFNGPPWFEEISLDEVLNRIEPAISGEGFGCLLAESEGAIIGALWYNALTSEELEAEKGIELGNFTKDQIQTEGVKNIIFTRETVVNPKYQGMGFASKLKSDFITQIETLYPDGALILTRHRSDNPAIIKTSEKLGYEKTGIKMPSSQNPDAYHEYWYKLIRPINERG